SIIALIALSATSALYLQSDKAYQARSDENAQTSEPNPMEWAWVDLRTGEHNPMARLEVQNMLRHNVSRTGELDLQFEMRGPDNVGGRTRAMVELKGKPDTLFAGGVTGGLWVSYNAGGTWEPHEQFENL